MGLTVRWKPAPTVERWGRISLSLGNGLEKLLARPLAATALFGANLAVLHAVLSVLLALVAATATHGDASLQDGARDIRVVLGLATDDSSCGSAHVSTVQVNADALGQVLNISLTEAVVGALRARLRAVVTRLDTAHQQLLVDVEIARITLEHSTGNIGNGHG